MFSLMNGKRLQDRIVSEQVQSSFNGKPKQSYGNRKSVACIFRGVRIEEECS